MERLIGVLLFAGHLSDEGPGVDDLNALIVLEFQQMIVAGDDVIRLGLHGAGEEFVVGGSFLILSVLYRSRLR